MRLTSICLAALGLAWAFTFTTAAASSPAERTKLTVSKAPPPKELAEPIRFALQPRVIRLAEGGKPFFEFWLRKGIPLAKKPSPDAFALTAVREGTVLGALKVHREQYDFKDDEILPGLYVLRFGIQPEDGDHLGTSPTQAFALLIPAKRDRKLDDLDHEQLMKASSTINAAEHPSNLNLQPVTEAKGDFPRLAAHNRGEHKVIYLRLPARIEGQKEPLALIFALVYEGIGDY